MKYLHISIYIFILVLILYQIVKDGKMQTLITQIYKIWPILRSTGTISEGVGLVWFFANCILPFKDILPYLPENLVLFLSQFYIRKMRLST